MKTLFRTIAFIVLTGLGFSAQGQDDLVDRLDKALGVTLPVEYKTMVKNNTKVQEVINNKLGAEFTEGFIKGEMQNSWGINRQNQLIFVWSAIYRQIANQDLYDGGDGDENRFNDFAEIVDQFEICGKRYADEFNAYMKQQSEAAKQQSEAAKQRSEAAKQQSVVAIKTGLYEIIRFYILYNGNPSIVKDEEVIQAQKSALFFISRSKELTIDYPLLVPTKVLEFYNIQTNENQRNTLTCEQATIQLLNILLKELVKLYNLHKTHDIESIINACKEYNIDYRAILLKELGSKQKVDELLKFYGVE